MGGREEGAHEHCEVFMLKRYGAWASEMEYMVGLILPIHECVSLRRACVAQNCPWKMQVTLTIVAVCLELVGEWVWGGRVCVQGGEGDW